MCVFMIELKTMLAKQALYHHSRLSFKNILLFLLYGTYIWSHPPGYKKKKRKIIV